MSSHREAPEISKDPVADNTDTYAFVSPDDPDSVTIITNYIPLEDPAGGPNFFEFGDDVLYQIYVDNDGDGRPDVWYEFRFKTEVRNPNTFLYNTGQITTIDSPNWNRRQFYDVVKVTEHGGRKVLGSHLACPPCNVGPRSTPNYAALGNAGVHLLDDEVKVFAGQRLDPFYVDLGSVFDLADLRPFQNLHLLPPHEIKPGVDSLRAFNVHTIAIQVQIRDLTRNGEQSPDVNEPESVIGVWGAASRQKGHVRDEDNDWHTGPWTQVSRLGNPLINEVIIPMGKKDHWNRLSPWQDSQFLAHYQHPELAALLPGLYPGVFPHLAAVTAARADLVAILLTGIPNGIITGFQNFTGTTQADMLRLNVAIPPSSSPNINGILGGDLAGFPNGRRVFDDIVTIEVRAIAGATYKLVAPSFVPDGAASLVTDGVTPPGNVTYLSHFPYCDHPKNGFDVVPLK